MTQLLKQSTAATIKIGPFVDSTDGVTAETGLTISQADIRLSKNGGAFAQTNNATGATHDENGYYGVPLDTTDTNTLGRLRVAVNESGALPVWQDFMVVNANVYDSLVGGSDNLQVDTVQIEGSDATDQINAAADTALADYDPPTKAELDSGLAALNDLDAAGVRSAVGLASANLDTQLGTIDTVVDGIQTDLDNGTDGLGAIKADTAAILIDTNELQTDDVPGLIAALNDPTAAAVADAVWDEAKAGHVAAGSFGEEVQAHALSSEISALNDLSAAEVNAEVDTALADYDAPTKAELDAGLAALNDLDAAGIRTAVGLASANLDTQLGALPTAAENRAEMDSNSTQLAAIVADTNELQTDSVPGLIAALNDPTAAAVADAVWDEARSGHTTAGTFGESFNGVVNGEAATGTLSTTQMTTNLTEATDDHYNGRIVVFITGVLAGQATDITDYTGSTKLITMTALTEAPSNGDRFVIV